MKVTIKVEKEVDIKTVLLQVNPRYIGDGDDDDISPSFPGLATGILTLEIDVDTGVVHGWPEGQEHSAYMKVCDAGSYYLKDREGSIVARIDQDYAPNRLIPGEYGDYIDLSIGGDGKVAKWPVNPDLSEFFKDGDD